MDRNEAIEIIKTELKKRSGKTWSVIGGKGTGWGWITIISPPKRRMAEFDYMTKEDCLELQRLLNLDKPVHNQGEMIAASSDYRLEYVARAKGEKPQKYGKIYWD